MRALILLTSLRSRTAPGFLMTQPRRSGTSTSFWRELRSRDGLFDTLLDRVRGAAKSTKGGRAWPRSPSFRAAVLGARR